MSGTSPALALVFSGQGSQYVGMADWLFDRHPEARRTLEEAEDTLGKPLGRWIRRGPDRELMRTANAQPAILTVSIALYRVLAPEAAPTAIAGHSVGEFSALVAAGSIDFERTVALVAARGRLMQKAVPRGRGGMVAVLGAGPVRLKLLCDEVTKGDVLEVAAQNCPGQTVLSGSLSAIERLEERLLVAGLPFSRLAVSAPFHSRLMRPAIGPLREMLDDLPVAAPQVPVVSCIDGRVLLGARTLRRRLLDATLSPIRFDLVLRRIASMGVKALIEVGPGRVLLGHARRTTPGIVRLGLGDHAELEAARRLASIPG